MKHEVSSFWDAGVCASLPQIHGDTNRRHNETALSYRVSVSVQKDEKHPRRVLFDSCRSLCPCVLQVKAGIITKLVFSTFCNSGNFFLNFKQTENTRSNL